MTVCLLFLSYNSCTPENIGRYLRTSIENHQIYQDSESCGKSLARDEHVLISENQSSCQWVGKGGNKAEESTSISRNFRLYISKRTRNRIDQSSMV